MFGRDSRYQDLFSSIKDISIYNKIERETEESIFALDYPHQDDQPGVTSLPLEQPPEEFALTDYRERINELAGENIRTEQLKQKRQYDKKVNQNRYRT